MLLTHLKQFIKLTRAHIGIAVLPSFWLGSLFALVLGYEFNIFIFLIGFLIIFLMYASASYINDYYDFEADKHNRQFGFSGGSGVLQKYPELKEPTRYLALIFIITSLILTIFLASISFIPFWSVLFIGIGSFFSWFYSAPPVRLSYRGVGEFPHFIAGVMNTAWGYMMLTGTIDMVLIIFAIPLSLHLLNVILLFEIPDKEADIHGGKTNFIVNHGRKNSFLLITILFWFTTIYFFSLAYIGWYSAFINFYLLAILSCFPSLIASMMYLKKPLEKNIATKSAIKTALSLFIFSISMILYFIILKF
ncbi:MAG TPA: prenyltransferase [Candidatus Thermoplasmatota archaeon]|nr:prenyltransferase [Candidatus Thermoplasmatota archaeon]